MHTLKRSAFSTCVLAAALLLAGAVHAADYALYNSSIEAGDGTTPYSWWRNNGGRESWAALTGSYGMALYGWNNGQDGSFGQDIGTAADGGGNGLAVDFGIWLLIEANYTADVNRLQIEFWTNGAPSTAARAQMVPGQNLNTYLTTNINNWGYYTMSATSQYDNLLGVKVLVYGGPFRSTGGSQALKADNATLAVHGGWGANLLNDPSFTGRSWSYSGQGGYEDWAGNFGGGFAFYGWNAGGSAAVWRAEAVTPNGGIFVFSIYGLTEELYASTTEDTKLELEVLDGSQSVLAAATNNVYWTLRNNSNKWNLVSVSLTNNNPTIAYARVRVSGSGFANPSGAGYKAAKWDTARLLQVPEPCAGLLMTGLAVAMLARRRC